MRYFIDLLQVLVWPLVVSIIAFIFKGEIKSVLINGFSIKAAGVEVQGRRSEEESRGALESQKKNPVVVMDSLEGSNLLKEYKTVIEENWKEKYAELETGKRSLENELTVARIELDFERIYNVIFGSQIRLLEKMQSVNGGVFRKYFDDHFVEIKRYSIPFFNDWTVDKYLEFLFKNDLIRQTRKDLIAVFDITIKAKVFLEYINRNGYRKDKAL